jgi:hypothetical protein
MSEQKVKDFEKKVKDFGYKIIEKQIELAKKKRDKFKISEVIKLESEILSLRREYNKELDEISNEEKTSIFVEE